MLGTEPVSGREECRRVQGPPFKVLSPFSCSYEEGFLCHFPPLSSPSEAHTTLQRQDKMVVSQERELFREAACIGSLPLSQSSGDSNAACGHGMQLS